MGNARGAVPCFLPPGLLEACSARRRTGVTWRVGSRGAGRGVPGRHGGGAHGGGHRGWARPPPGCVSPPRTDGIVRPCAQVRGGRGRPGPGRRGSSCSLGASTPSRKQSVESLVVSCAAWWPPPSVPSPARRLDSTPAARTQLLYPSPCRFPNSPSALYSPVPHPPFHLFLLPVLPRPAPASFSLVSSFSCLTLHSRTSPFSSLTI